MLGWTFDTQERPECLPDIEEIYEKYKRLMYATAGKFTSNVEDQKDIVQTALERLIKIFSVPRPEKCCISARYIVFTVRSVSVDFLRKQSRETGHCVSMEDDLLSKAVSIDRPLENLLLAADHAERLRDIWPRLTLEGQILLEGKYILCLTDEELAATLNCKTSSVRMKLTRARRQAMKLLSSERSNL